MSETRLNGHTDHCTCRPCRIIVLLQRLPDVEDRGASGGSSVTAGGPTLMGLEWHHPSYRELRRILFLMLAQPLLKDRRHMLAYFEAPKRQRKRRIKVRGPHGKMVDTDAWVMDPLIPTWVDLARVKAGLGFVTGSFRGDPSLPDAFILTDEQLIERRKGRVAA